MHLYSPVIALAFLIPVLAAPSSLVPVEKVDGETSGRHIVTLKPGVDRSSFVFATNIVPTHNWTVINGFAGEFTEEQINMLRANGDVESISEDGTVQASVVATQFNATWGLARLSSVKKLANQTPDALNFQFIYETTAGAGVDIYVLDTGVNIVHTEFGGRARWGATFGGYASVDNNGHGTHCAGTAGGRTVGVARAANIIAVKVLGDDGRGFNSDAISGLDWVRSQVSTSRRPSVVSMSISSNAPSSTFENAVTSLISTGVHVVVSAGNDNIDAANVSPARAAGAIAVGASNIADSKASFSNYGSVVAIFAPGERIISTYIGGTTALASYSGTSQACPHVAGLVAYLISSRGNTTPATMRANVKSLALNGILTNIPTGTNQLAQNGLAPK